MNVCDGNKVVTALKNTWVHSKVKGCQKTMICIKGNLLVFIQYIGLNNQHKLKLGKRQIRPSTSKMVTNKLKNVKSTKSIVHNVTKEIAGSDDEFPHPSKLPFYRHVTWIKEEEKFIR